MIYLLLPLPPPTGGFSLASESFAKNLLRTRTDIKLFNKSKNICADRFLLLIELFSNRKSISTLYIALSAGKGLILDFVYAFIAFCLGIKVVFHHHSFSYLIKKNSTINFFRTYLPSFSLSINHIFLCECMKTSYLKMYKTVFDSSNAFVLSNISLIGANDVTLDDPFAGQNSRPLRPIRIGMLSNLTREKGVDDFLSLVDAFNSSQLSRLVSFHLAGPCGDDLKSDIQSYANKSVSLAYMGPIYKEQKKHFFENIDVFVFPTKYKNEAEPLVLYEALSYGALVYSYERGCIGSEMSSLIRVSSCFAELLHELTLLAKYFSVSESRQLNEERRERITLYASELDSKSSQLSNVIRWFS